MSGFPPELIYLLIFVGAILYQYLVKRRASRQPPEPEQDEHGAQAAHDLSADAFTLQQAAPMAWPQLPPSTHRARSPAAPAPRAPARRRFARESLLATRRDVQNAIVIATILGPCRALEPPGNEQPARGVRQGRVAGHSAAAAQALTGHL